MLTMTFSQMRRQIKQLEVLMAVKTRIRQMRDLVEGTVV